MWKRNKLENHLHIAVIMSNELCVAGSEVREINPIHNKNAMHSLAWSYLVLHRNCLVFSGNARIL